MTVTEITDTTANIGDISTDQALADGSAASRCFARLTVSAAHDAIIRFINAEIDRGTEDTDVLIAFGRYMVQIHASIAAHTFDLSAASVLSEALKGQVDSIYLGHMERSQSALGELGAKT